MHWEDWEHERKRLGVCSWQWRWSGGGVSKLVVSAEDVQQGKLIHYWVHDKFPWAYYFWEQSALCWKNNMGTVVILLPAGAQVWDWDTRTVEVSPALFKETSVIGYSLSDNPRDIITLQHRNIKIKGFVNGASWLVAIEIKKDRKKPDFMQKSLTQVLKYESLGCASEGFHVSCRLLLHYVWWSDLQEISLVKPA